MPQPHSPTARGRKLGSELRRIREEAGLTLDQASDLLGEGWSRFKVGRIEKAKTKPTDEAVKQMLALYGVDTATRAVVLDLLKNAWQRGWWEDYSDLFPNGSYVAQEDDAERIEDWGPQLVPGLLQTPEYAAAVIRAWQRSDEDDVQRRLRARMQRKALIERKDPPAPKLTAILDEAVLRRPVGGKDVMRAQLRALVDAGRRPNVTVLVVPFSAGAHAGLDGPFIILGFPGEITPDVAYVETKAGGNHIESIEGVKRFKLDLKNLKAAALSPEGSAELIVAIAEE